MTTESSHGSVTITTYCKDAHTLQQQYEFIWIRTTCDYLVECSLLHAV